MRTKLPRSFLFLTMAVLILGNMYLYGSLFSINDLKVSILRVGKEEKIVLVQTPDRKTILINTGPDASILRALGTALPPWQRTLDAVVLTESSATAAKGLSAVAEHYHVLTPPQKRKNLQIDGETFINANIPSKIAIFYKESSIYITKNTPEGVFSSDGKTFTVR